MTYIQSVPSTAAPVPSVTPAVPQQATLAPIIITGGATLDVGQAVTSWTWTCAEIRYDGTVVDVSATALSSTTAQSPTLNPRGFGRTYRLTLVVAQTDAQTGPASGVVYISAPQSIFAVPDPSVFTVVA